MDIGQQVQAAPTDAAHVSLCLRDEEAAGSNPATPTEKRQVTGHLMTCRSHYAFPDVRFWEPVGSEHK